MSLPLNKPSIILNSELVWDFFEAFFFRSRWIQGYPRLHNIKAEINSGGGGSPLIPVLGSQAFNSSPRGSIKCEAREA